MTGDLRCIRKPEASSPVTSSMIAALNRVPLAEISVCCSDVLTVGKKNPLLFQGIENSSVAHFLIKETQ